MTKLWSTYGAAVAATWTLFSTPLVLSDEASNFGTIGTEIRKVGDDLFDDYPELEPSGLVWLSHKRLLAGVSDEGSVFLFNPDDNDEYYVDGKVNNLPDDFGDFEGVTVDTYLIVSDAEPDHLYIANEDPPAIIKVKYTIPDDKDNHGDLDVDYVDHFDIDISGFDSTKGLESLTLLEPGTATADPIFLIGLQDDGTLFMIDAKGNQVGEPFTAGIGISASQYDPNTCLLFAASDAEDRFGAIDLKTQKLVAEWVSQGTHEEGLALRDGILIYVASDEGDDDSFVSEYGWVVPAPESVCDGGVAINGDDGGMAIEGSESSSTWAGPDSSASFLSIMALIGLAMLRA